MPSKPVAARSKSALLARLKCPFPGDFTMPIFGAGGNTKVIIDLRSTLCHTYPRAG